MRKPMRRLWDAVTLGIAAYRYRRMQAARGLTVLMYHRVLPDDICAEYPLWKLAMPASAFERQMEWLARHCEVAPLGEALKLAEQGRYQRAGRVCITFDDGYLDNAQVAVPILEKCGLRATFFVTTGFVAGGQLQWFDRAALHWRQSRRERIHSAVADVMLDGRTKMHGVWNQDAWMALLKAMDAAKRQAVLDRLDAAGRLEYGRELYSAMTVEQLRTLHDRGHEIGSHTVTHAILPQLSDGPLRMELEQSQAALTRWLGKPVTGLCYPNGNHDVRVIAAARAAGFGYACTTTPGVVKPGMDPMRLSRRAVRPARCGEFAGRTIGLGGSLS